MKLIDDAMSLLKQLEAVTVELGNLDPLSRPAMEEALTYLDHTTAAILRLQRRQDYLVKVCAPTPGTLLVWHHGKKEYPCRYHVAGFNNREIILDWVNPHCPRKRFRRTDGVLIVERRSTERHCIDPTELKEFNSGNSVKMRA